MDNRSLTKEIVDLVGGVQNIKDATNCVTRLRLRLVDNEMADIDALKKLEGVMSVVEDETLQIVVGPGKSRNLLDIITEEFGVNKSSNHWENNKKSVKKGQTDTALKRGIRAIANIFVPLIPAIIASGMFLGFGNVIGQLQNQGVISAETSSIWTIIKLMFSLFGSGFLGYFAIFAGINSAKQFGATEALGGMIGAISISSGIVDVAMFLNLYNIDVPNNSFLMPGKGGLLGVIFGVWLLAFVEKRIRKIVPDVLELIITPVLTLLIVGSIYVLAVMPMAGVASDVIFTGLGALINSPNIVIRVLTGFVSAAVFLPLVLTGLHHGVSVIYALQLEQLGGITLLPVLTQAGAGQVGAAIAIYFKSKKVRNQKLKEAVLAGLPAGLLGISEPLMYGVTLPLGKAFITAGLGSGFGGAFVMAMNVMAVSWGTGGWVAAPLMTAGPNGLMGIIYFIIGLFISYIMGFIITYVFIKDEDVQNLII